MTTFEESVKNTRKAIDDIASNLLELKKMAQESEEREDENRGEVIANIMLSYRHLEDAKMRLGKVFQALDGGVSVYDK